MKYEMKIERSGSDKVTVEFAKYHSTGASEFRSVDLYDDEVKMLKEEFCGQLEKKLAEAKEIIKDLLLMAKVEHLEERYESVEEAQEFLKGNESWNLTNQKFTDR